MYIHRVKSIIIHLYTYNKLYHVHRVKSRMDASERVLCGNVAKVVKWADFDSRSPMSGAADWKLVRLWVQEFERALGVSSTCTVY